MTETTDMLSAVPRVPNVFLSYSREDRDRALVVIKALTNQKINVWWDGLLAGGDSFARTTEDALEAADAVVVLWSARSVQSHWVRDEATHGRDRGCMIPVSIDGTAPPLGFRQIQYINLSKWRGKASAREFTELLNSIANTAAANPADAPQIHRAKTALPKTSLALSRRRALMIGGGMVAAIGGGLVVWRSRIIGGDDAMNSVAVLPFKNISGDADQDYLAEGLSEELRATLSLNRQLDVAAQTSSSRFGDDRADARAIARKLGVAFVVDGSVRRSGDALRITAQLIDGATGFQDWTQSFDYKVADIFAMQSEIAATVADTLAVQLSGDSDTAIDRMGGTRNTSAFDDYLRGKALYKRADGEDSDRRALAMFDRALAADPAYAAAHAARSRALTVIANNHASGRELKALYAKSIGAAREAVRLAPDLAEGHSALGFVLFNGRLDIGGAAAPYRKSYDLGYGNADILSAFASYAGRTGSFDTARQAIHRAQRLDPLNANVFRNAGVIEYGARDFAAAAGPLRTALSLKPDVIGVHVVLGDIALMGGDLAAARAAYAREPGKLSRLRGLAIADHNISGTAAATEHLDDLVAEFGSNAFYQQAQVRAQWGESDAALTALESAFLAGDSGLVQSGNDPLLDPIRGQPRFAAVQQKLGFTKDARPA